MSPLATAGGEGTGTVKGIGGAGAIQGGQSGASVWWGEALEPTEEPGRRRAAAVPTAGSLGAAGVGGWPAAAWREETDR